MPPSVWPTVGCEYAALVEPSTVGRYAALAAPYVAAPARACDQESWVWGLLRSARSTTSASASDVRRSAMSAGIPGTEPGGRGSAGTTPRGARHGSLADGGAAGAP